MNFLIEDAYKSCSDEILSALNLFNSEGKLLVDGERNKIKVFELCGFSVNIKSFKTPNFFNRLVYKYLRKSKSRRSFEFAQILLQKGIGTPQPIAYQENYNFLGLNRSFYVSKQQEYDLTFRELIEVKNYPDHDNILRQFTRFCYRMHQAGIEFKDHSPGNTLIKKESEVLYGFYLVDLNRMKFHDSMDIRLRMKNLSRLTSKKDMVSVMANEYARISGEEPEKLFELLWSFTQSFQKRYHRKQKTKRKIKSFFK